MTRNEANLILAAILTTIAAIPEGAPEGVMYAALMGQCSLSDFQGLLGICQQTGLVREESAHLFVATDKGREMAARIEAHSKRVA